MDQKLVSLYRKSVNELGVREANCKDNMNKIASAIGYQNARQVRLELQRGGVYESAVKARPVRGTRKLLKIDYILKIQSICVEIALDVEVEELLDLKKAQMVDLQLYIQLLSNLSMKKIVVIPDEESRQLDSSDLFIPSFNDSRHQVKLLVNLAKAKGVNLRRSSFESFENCTEDTVRILNRIARTVEALKAK